MFNNNNKLKLFGQSFNNIEDLELMLKVEQLLEKEYPLEDKKLKKEKFLISLINLENIINFNKLKSFLIKEELENLTLLKKRKEKNIIIRKRCLKKENCEIRVKAFFNLKNLDKDKGKIWPLGDFYGKGHGLIESNLYKAIVEEKEVCIICKIKMVKNLNNLLNNLYVYNNINYLINYTNDNIIELNAYHVWNQKKFNESFANCKLRKGIKPIITKYEKLLYDLHDKNNAIIIFCKMLSEDINNFKIFSPEDYSYSFVKERDLLYLKSFLFRIAKKLDFSNEKIDEIINKELNPLSLTAVIEKKEDKKLILSINELNFLEKASIEKDKKFRIKLIDLFKEYDIIDKNINLDENVNLYLEKTLANNRPKVIRRIKKNDNLPKIIKRNYHQNYKLCNLGFGQESIIDNFLKPKLKQSVDFGKKAGKTIYQNSPEIINPTKKIIKKSGEFVQSKAKDSVDFVIDQKQKYNKTGFSPKSVLIQQLVKDKGGLTLTQINKIKQIENEVKQQAALKAKKLAEIEIRKKKAIDAAIALENLKKQNSPRSNNTLEETKILQKSLFWNLWETPYISFFQYPWIYLKAIGSIIKYNMNYYLNYIKMCIMRRYALITWPPIFTIMHEYWNNCINYFNNIWENLLTFLNYILVLFNSLNSIWQSIIIVLIIYFIFKFYKEIWFIITLPFKLIKKLYKFLFKYDQLADQRKEIDEKNAILLKNLLEKEKKKKITKLENKIFKRHFHTNYKLQNPKTLGSKKPFVEYAQKYLLEKWKDPSMREGLLRRIIMYAHPSSLWKLVKGTTLDKLQALVTTTGRVALGYGLNLFIKRAIQGLIMTGFTALNLYYPQFSLVSPVVEKVVPYISDIFTVISLGKIEAAKDWLWPKKQFVSHTLNDSLREIIIKQGDLPFNEKLGKHWNKPLTLTPEIVAQHQPDLPPLDHGNLTEVEKVEIKKYENWQKINEKVQVTEDLKNDNSVIKWIAIGLCIVGIGLGIYYIISSGSIDPYYQSLTTWWNTKAEITTTNEVANNTNDVAGGVASDSVSINQQPEQQSNSDIDSVDGDNSPISQNNMEETITKAKEGSEEVGNTWIETIKDTFYDCWYWIKEKLSFNHVPVDQNLENIEIPTKLEKEMEDLERIPEELRQRQFDAYMAAKKNAETTVFNDLEVEKKKFYNKFKFRGPTANDYSSSSSEEKPFPTLNLDDEA